MMDERIRKKSLRDKVVTAKEAAESISEGMSIATSGFTYCGYPLSFFKALGERAKKGEIKGLTFWSSGLFGYDVEGILAEHGALLRRIGSHGDAKLRNEINKSHVFCNDIRTDVLPGMLRSGRLGKLDVAIINCVGITEQGQIILSDAVIDAPSLAEQADRVVLEVNHTLPLELEGIHDIYLPPRNAKTDVPLSALTDRIGSPYVSVEENKIAFIVECNDPYPERSYFQPFDERCEKIGNLVISFLQHEVDEDRLPKTLKPIECGIGRTANSVMECLGKGNFRDLEIYSAGITDEIVDLVEAEKVRIVNTTGLRLSSDCRRKVFQNLSFYKEKIILRPTEVIHNASILRRLGLIAINGALEIDIYGNINSSHILGTKLLNGIGGSAVFAINADISIFTLFSTGKNGNISSIVPMVPHVDHPVHYVDIVVTERGAADLRGLSPIERAEKLIECCTHPDYRPLLRDYLEKAKKEVGGHQPHLLEEAFSFHQRFKETGTMNIV